ncbi:transketolase [Sporobacter termitidis DSM 10068]|uniref:Transketolase n=1 Tax=Sporobacter termitidis DSM 10068 TaxID=1123282 RepID=A0A1M5YMD6_9FIRM|nr:transketolase [Sporobacter termitidis]SHI12723.1 transketolase [Sporobacter termitidis DSM 10068]
MSEKKNLTIPELEEKAYKIRHDLLNFIYRIGMGHLGGELSMVEVAVAAYYKYLNYDVHNTCDENRDRFILSKGHCSETLFTIFSDLGAYTMDYMVEHFETLDTAKFGMHSNRKYCEQIEVSAGSLGHGLPVAVGYALGARKQKKNYRVFVLTGDGELNEGTNWEALMSGAHFGLSNLVLIVDKNALQMTGTTEEIMNIDPLDKKLEAFNWNVLNVADGNDMAQVCAAFDKLPPVDHSKKGKPTAIIANTVKGKGVDFMEGNHKWHGGGIAKEQLEQALASLEKSKKEKK